jgi:hypothetical protein
MAIKKQKYHYGAKYFSRNKVKSNTKKIFDKILLYFYLISMTNNLTVGCFRTEPTEIHKINFNNITKLDSILTIIGGDTEDINRDQIDIDKLVESIVSKSKQSSNETLSPNKVLKKALELTKQILTNQQFLRIVSENLLKRLKNTII